MSRRITLLGLTVVCLFAVTAAAKPHARPSNLKVDNCVLQCIQGGGDSICCRYLCHPIGQNPC